MYPQNINPSGSLIKYINYINNALLLLLFCCSIIPDSLGPHELAHARLHSLLEFAETHVHWVMMPSNHLILCRPLLLLPSIFPQHQGLFQWVGSLCKVAKVLELQLQHWSFQWISKVDMLFILKWLLFEILKFWSILKYLRVVKSPINTRKILEKKRKILEF